MKKKSKINVCLCISFVLGLMYSIYAITYFGNSLFTTSGAELLGSSIASMLVTPHLLVTVLAVIFNALGCFLRKPGFALTGAILYTVAIVLFIPYFMFVFVQMILSYIGASQLRKSNKVVE